MGVNVQRGVFFRKMNKKAEKTVLASGRRQLQWTSLISEGHTTWIQREPTEKMPGIPQLVSTYRHKRLKHGVFWPDSTRYWSKWSWGSTRRLELPDTISTWSGMTPGVQIETQSTGKTAWASCGGDSTQHKEKKKVSTQKSRFDGEHSTGCTPSAPIQLF